MNFVSHKVVDIEPMYEKNPVCLLQNSIDEIVVR